MKITVEAKSRGPGKGAARESKDTQVPEVEEEGEIKGAEKGYDKKVRLTGSCSKVLEEQDDNPTEMLRRD